MSSEAPDCRGVDEPQIVDRTAGVSSEALDCSRRCRNEQQVLPVVSKDLQVNLRMFPCLERDKFA